MTHSPETGTTGETLSYEDRLRDLIEKSGLDIRLHEVACEALNHYTAELPYHNVEHMFEVTENTIALCDQYQVIGTDRSTLILAALWHDADYHIPLDNYEISKEHHSAQLCFNAVMGAAQDATPDDREYLEAVAEWSASLIISTHADRVPADIYEQILNQADTANLSGDSPRMLQNSGMLFVESKILAGEEILGSIEDYVSTRAQELSDWCTSTQGILSKIIQNKLGSTKLLAVAKNNQLLMTPVNIIRAISQRSSTD